MNFFVLAAVVFGAVFLGTSGVDAQCYNCTFTTMGEMMLGPRGCNDPFDGTDIQIIPCTRKCSTASTSMDAAPDGSTPAMTVILRTCEAEQPPCIPLDNMAVAEGVTVTQTCCTGELCNDGVAAAGGVQATTAKPNAGEGDVNANDGAQADVTTAKPNAAGIINFSLALAIIAPLGALVF